MSQAKEGREEESRPKGSIVGIRAISLRQGLFLCFLFYLLAWVALLIISYIYQVGCYGLCR